MQVQISEKIRIIRQHRGLTQKQLGVALGYGENDADNRIRKYELNIRTPREDVVAKLAAVLRVNRINFISLESGSLENIMQTLFWLEEGNPGLVKLFSLEKNPRKKTAELNSEPAENDVFAKYDDSDYWPAHSPVGVWFNNRQLDDFLREWKLRKDELRAKEITREEYFEWKLNWPFTCDGMENSKSYISWRGAR